MSLELDDVKRMKGIKLLYLNVRSLLKHLDEVKLNLLSGEFDIVVCGESWLHKNVADSLLYCTGYTLYRCDRQTINHTGHTKAGGGLCVYARDDLKILNLDSCNMSNRDIETINLGIQKGNSKRFTVCAVYRPPTGNTDNFINSLERCIVGCNNIFGGDILLTGDMNIDLTRQKCSQKKKLLSLTGKLGLTSHVNTHTRITQTSSTTIDLIFSNFDHVYSSGTVNLNLSDHLPVYIVKKKEREEKKSIFICGRSYSNFDEESFKIDIQNIDVNLLFNDSDPNVVWSKMISHIMKIADYHCPVRQLKITPSRPGYLSDELIELMKDRDLAFKSARRLNDDDSWANARELRSLVQSEILRARREFIHNLISSSEGDNRKFWDSINKEFFKTSSRKIDNVFDNYDTLLEGAAATNFINSYFCKVSAEMSGKFSGNPLFSSTKVPSVTVDRINSVGVRSVMD